MVETWLALDRHNPGMQTAEVWDHWLEGLEPEFKGYVVCHPPTCFAVHHWEAGGGGILAYAPHLSLERPRCVIEHEVVNVGLLDRSPLHDDDWGQLWHEDYPGGIDAILALVEAHAASQTRMPIYVKVTAGWTLDTLAAPAEYEWEFLWRPQTSEEVEAHG